MLALSLVGVCMCMCIDMAYHANAIVASVSKAFTGKRFILCYPLNPILRQNECIVVATCLRQQKKKKRIQIVDEIQKK